MVGAKSCKLFREVAQGAAVTGVLSAGFVREEVCLGWNEFWGEWWRSTEGCPVSVGLGDTAGMESTDTYVK